MQLDKLNRRAAFLTNEWKKQNNNASNYILDKPYIENKSNYIRKYRNIKPVSCTA